MIHQQDNYDLHLTHEPLSPPCVKTKTFGERSFSYAGPSVWNNLPQTLRHSDSTSSFKAALNTHLFNITKLFFTALPIPSSDTVCVCVRVSVHVCVVSVIVKCPVLPPSVVDGRSRNPLYYYYTTHKNINHP